MNSKINLLFLTLIFLSCKTTQIPTEESQVFKILNQVNFLHSSFTDNDETKNSLGDYLNTNQLSTLKKWLKEASALEIYEEECATCPSAISKLKPIYKVSKGNFIHFGIKKNDGIKNLVFKKNGSFLTHFYTYQAFSPTELKAELQKKDRANIIESISPNKISANKIHLKYKAHYKKNENVDCYDNWYATEIEYAINLKEEEPILRFKYLGGLVHCQRNNAKGELQDIHFYQSGFAQNAVAAGELGGSYTYAKGYFGKATFILLSLKNETEVSIKIDSKVTGQNFQFSIIDNNTFRTLDEYVDTESELHTNYKAKLKKGEYLVRVLNGNLNETNVVLFGVLIDLKDLK